MSSLLFIPNADQPLDILFVSISSGFTLIGCCFIIFCYLYYKETREFNIKLVFILTINDLIIALIFSVNSHLDTNYSATIRQWLPFVCSVPDALLHYFFISSFCWTVSIAHMLLRVIKYNELDVQRKYYKFYHLFSWGLPLLLLGSLFLTRWITKADCKIYSELYPHLLFFVPLLLAWLYNVVVCIIVTRKLRKDHERNNKRDSLSSSFDDGDQRAPFMRMPYTPTVVRTHILFLISFAICWVWAIIVVVAIIVEPQTWDKSKTINFFLTLSYVFTPLQGFLNSIIFGLHEELWAKMKESIVKTVRLAVYYVSNYHHDHNYINDEEGADGHNPPLLHEPNYDDEDDGEYFNGAHAGGNDFFIHSINNDNSINVNNININSND